MPSALFYNQRPKPDSTRTRLKFVPYLKGLAEDYATLSKALQRLTNAELPVHMTMGNHDDRGPFYKAFSNHRPDNPLVEGKHVSILSSPTVNLFLVDSLLEVNKVTGEIGAPQPD